MRRGRLYNGIKKLTLAARQSAIVQRAMAFAEEQIQFRSIGQAKVIVALADAVLGPAASFDLWFRRGIVKSNSGDLDEAIESMKNAYAILPDNPSVVYALGSLLAHRREFVEADKLFARDVSVMTGSGSHTYTRALSFFRKYEPQGKFPRTRVDLSHQMIGSIDRRSIVYLVAADSVYFCRYAQALARSIELFGGKNILLHFHVVNPDQQSRELFSTLLARYSNIRVSTELYNLDEFSDAQRKTYYSCARYLILSEIITELGLPVVVADMDQMLMSDPTPLLKIAHGADVTLMRFENQYHNILSLLSATLMVVRPTDGGAKFVTELESYIKASISNPVNLTWHLDQAALAITYLSNEGIEYGYIPASMVHLEPGEPNSDRPFDVGIFWSITNSIAENLKKVETASFSQLLRS